MVSRDLVLASHLLWYKGPEQGMAFYQLSFIGKDSVQEFENDVILDVCSNIHQYIYTEYIGGFSDAGINRTGLNCIDKIIRPDGPHFSQGFGCLFNADKPYSANR